MDPPTEVVPVFEVPRERDISAQSFQNSVNDFGLVKIPESTRSALVRQIMQSVHAERDVFPLWPRATCGPLRLPFSSFSLEAVLVK